MALPVKRVWGAKLSSLATSGSRPCCGAHLLPDGEDAAWHSLGDVTDGVNFAIEFEGS
jgi:hypothetical protein